METVGEGYAFSKSPSEKWLSDISRL
jgi:hypothetical protein